MVLLSAPSYVGGVGSCSYTALIRNFRECYFLPQIPSLSKQLSVSHSFPVQPRTLFLLPHCLGCSLVFLFISSTEDSGTKKALLTCCIVLMLSVQVEHQATSPGVCSLSDLDLLLCWMACHRSAWATLETWKHNKPVAPHFVLSRQVTLVDLLDPLICLLFHIA